MMRRPSLPILIFSFLLPQAAFSQWDPLGVKKAADRLADTAGKLPAQLQESVGVSIASLSNELHARLNDVQNLVPVVGAELATQLDHAGIVATALADHLDNIIAQRLTQLTHAAAQLLKVLQQTVQQSLDRIDAMVRDWIQLTEGSAIKVIDVANKKAIRITRQIYLDLIRFASIVLLFTGLLLLGLRFLALWGTNWDWNKLKANKPVVSLLMGVFLVFFSGTATLAVFPESLGALSARVRNVPFNNPCRQLRAEIETKKVFDQSQNAVLSEILDKRARGVYKKCREGI